MSSAMTLLSKNNKMAQRRMGFEKENRPKIDASFIVIRMGLFTRLDTVRNHFEKYGEVKDVIAIHHGDPDNITDGLVLNFTRCCEVQMNLTPSMKKKILKKKYHSLDNLKVRVKRYKGREAHKSLFEEGGHKLVLSGFATDFYISNLIDRTFNRCGGGVSGLELDKDEDGVLTGAAEIHFGRQADCDAALEVAKQHLVFEGCTVWRD